MGKNRMNRNLSQSQPSNNRFDGSSNIPNCFQFGDGPPSNPIYPDPRSIKREEDIDSKNCAYGSINKPPWQKNRENPSDWNANLQEQSWDRRRNMDHENFSNRMQGEQSRQSGRENPNSRNISQERDGSGMANKGPTGLNWNDDKRGPPESFWSGSRGPSGPNWETNSKGPGANWNDGPRGPANTDEGKQRDSGSGWDDRSRGPSGLNRGDGARGPPGPNWDDGPRGPPGPKWEDCPRGPSGPNWDDGPRGPPGPNWDDSSRGPPGPNREDGPRGPSGPGRNWDDVPRDSSGPNWNDGPRGSGPNWDDGPRGPFGPEWDGGPGNTRDDGPRGPSGPNWGDGPRGSSGPNYDDRSNGPPRSNWDDGPRRPTQPDWDNATRGPMAPDFEDRSRGPPMPNWDGGPRFPEMNWADGRRAPESPWNDTPSGSSGAFRNEDNFRSEWNNRFGGPTESDWRDGPRGPLEMNRGMPEGPIMSSCDGPRDSDMPRKLMDLEYMDIGRNFEGGRVENRLGGGSAQRRGRKPSPKRPRSPDRNVWSRLESEDSWNDQRSKRLRMSERPNTINRREEELALKERERMEMSCQNSRPGQIAPATDLRSKLARKERPLREELMSPKEVFICPRFFRQKFSAKDLEAIRNSLIKKLYDMAKTDDGIKSSPQLRFLDIKLVSRRRIIITCQDETTVKWLLDWYPLGLRVRIRIILPEDPLSLTVIGFIIKGMGKLEPDTLKNALRTQNPGLDVAVWRNGNVRTTKKGQAYAFLVDGHSVRYLIANRWELFYEMQKLFVRRMGTSDAAAS